MCYVAVAGSGTGILCAGDCVAISLTVYEEKVLGRRVGT